MYRLGFSNIGIGNFITDRTDYHKHRAQVQSLGFLYLNNPFLLQRVAVLVEANNLQILADLGVDHNLAT